MIVEPSSGNGTGQRSANHAKTRSAACAYGATSSDRHRFAKFRCSDRRLLSTGAGTDDDEIVLSRGWVHVRLLNRNDAAARRRFGATWQRSRGAQRGHEGRFGH